MRLEEESRLYFERGCNCAQSVFTPIAKRLGMNPSIALKIAAPFGGGMSHMGQTCGAVTGGVMGIGLAEGTARHDTVQEAVCSELAVAFQNRFIELHGDLTCPGLLCAGEKLLD
jgi:C_GCAxxG_C_C family probable redox protein